MNIFLNIQQEATSKDRGYMGRVLNIIQSIPLDRRINLRGTKEQYNAMLLPHTGARKIKGSSCSGARIFTKYSY